MTLELEWIRPAPFSFDWLLPSGDTVFANETARDAALAAIIGQPGIAGDGGSVIEFVQTSPAQQWLINHNLGRAPRAVRVLTPGGIEMVGDVIDLTVNQSRIDFAAPVAGRASII